MVPPKYRSLCSQITPIISPGNYYLAGPDHTVWACNTGLTPCISGNHWSQTSEFCVLVEVWPRITYHEPGYLYDHLGQKARFPREPVTLTLAILLGGLTVGGIGAGIGTGVAALSKTDGLQQLQRAMHEDLQALEESVSALEKSLTSLSEVVLQNRRGLDILFLKEGGLCIALKEECCFYADHTGIVRDNMAKLKERLSQREKLFKEGQSWYEGWFNKAPWFTTLISSLIGPLIILLLILLFGPCILNKLVQFVRDRMSVIQAFAIALQYHRPNPEEETQIL